MQFHKYSASSTNSLKAPLIRTSNGSRTIIGQVVLGLSVLRLKMVEMESRRPSLVSLGPITDHLMISVHLVYSNYIVLTLGPLIISLPAFSTPANAMLSVELRNLARSLERIGNFTDISSTAMSLSLRIEKAIWETTVRLYSASISRTSTEEL